MARTVPSDISRMALAGAHSPELATLGLLRKQLPDDYTVFHGVHWTREYGSRTSFGEIDFVVVNRSGEVLFIEQKEGVVEESADGDQNLYGKPEVELDGFVTWRCRDNYRTPESIARFIRETLPVAFEPRNDLPGLGVEVHGYADPADRVRIVNRIIQDRVRQGFDHEDIVILSCHGLEKSVFFQIESIGGIPLRRPTKEYRDHKQVFTPGRIGYDNIYRYKGQQSPAVILVDVDPDPGRLEQAQRTLYCGMTRATVRLDIVANGANRENDVLFKAGAS